MTEPPLEQSPSGSHIRIAGTKLSVHRKDLDNLVLQSVRQVAESRDTSFWMTVNNELCKDEIPAFGRAPQLHILHTPNQYRAQTTYWWEFKARNLPISAFLFIHVQASYAGYRATSAGPAPQTINIALVSPSTHCHESLQLTTMVDVDGYEQVTQVKAISTRPTYNTGLKIQEFLRDNPRDLTLGETMFRSDERGAVAFVLSKVREFEQLQTIQIVDARDPENPGWIELEIYDSNTSHEAIAEMVDYLDSTTNIAKALEHFKAFCDVMRSTGVVIAPLEENAFAKALISGTDEGVTVRIGPLANDVLEEGDNSYHEVTLHIPTGTILVNCLVEHHSPDDAATAWETAQTLARLTGQEDDFKDFARDFVSNGMESRRKKILKQRRKAQTQQ